MRKRTYKLRLEEVERLRRKMCLTLEDLAKAADVNLRTLGRWLEGGEILARNLGSLASALCTTPQAIVDGEPLTAANNVVNVNVQFNLAFSTIQRAEDVRMLVERLKVAIGAIGEITVLGTQEGSVRLSLEMSEDDWGRLLKAFMSGKLDTLNLTELISPPESEMLFPPAFFVHESIGKKTDIPPDMVDFLTAINDAYSREELPDSGCFIVRMGDRLRIVRLHVEKKNSPPENPTDTTAD